MASDFFVGIAQADLMIDNSHSLKEKRRVVAGLKERLKHRFSVSVCEYGDQQLWQRVQMALVFCSNDRTSVQTVFNELRDFFQQTRACTLLNLTTRML